MSEQDNKKEIKNEKQNPSIEEELMKIGKGAEIFLDSLDVAYAAFEFLDVRKIVRLDSKEFSNWLSFGYYQKFKKVPKKANLASVISIMDFSARSLGRRRTLHNRIARVGNEIFIDLANDTWQAVKVDSQGWKVLKRFPAIFRRFPHQAALPVPKKGGNLKDLLKFLNLRSKSDEILLLSWIVTSFFADIPRKVLCLHGIQGSAKTTAARMIRSLIDPSRITSVDIGSRPQDLAQALDHHAVPLFDNLSGLNKWSQDMVCKAVTGGGYNKRAHYTNDEDFLMDYKRAIIMTGINIPISAPDLFDRSLLVRLDRIPKTERKVEADLWSEFEYIRPKLFGAILDVLVEAMKIYPKIKLPELPRMADYAEWGAAAAVALGYTQEEFMAAMFGNEEEQIEEIIESDPLAQSIMTLIDDKQEWTGSATELLKVLSEEYRQVKDSKDKSWPKAANALTRRINILKSTLEDVGIDIDMVPGRSKGRLISISKRQKQDSNHLYLVSKIDSEAIEGVQEDIQEEIEEDRPMEDSDDWVNQDDPGLDFGSDEDYDEDEEVNNVFI